MFYSLVFSLVLLVTIQSSDGLQCYKCSCFVQPGETTCSSEADLQCVIQYVENSYCVIDRTLTDIEFGHNPNSALIALENLHYLRASEEIVYSNNMWQPPTIAEISYGCDWSLCNSPRILKLLPDSLIFTVNSTALTNAFIPDASESLVSCLSCSNCVNSSSSALICATPSCNGTCYIDDHLDDPQFNVGSCLFAFESSCESAVLPTSITIIGTFYLEENDFEINDVDVYCRKTNCNDPTHIQIIQQTTSYSATVNDQLFFRPDILNPSTPPPMTGLFGCYKCECEQDIGENSCSPLSCELAYANGSYCEIVLDFSQFPDREIILLGHVPQGAVPFKHFIRAEEKIVFSPDQTWQPPSVSIITYVCDWEFCNDGRLVDQLISSFQFNIDTSDVTDLIHNPTGINACYSCTLCTNSSIDIESNCPSVPCSSPGRCYIGEYLDGILNPDCTYAYTASCETIDETSIGISAIYRIDDDEFDIEEMDLYCSVTNCNQPLVVETLRNKLYENILLDEIFFFRPVDETTTPPIITEPPPSSSTNPPESSTNAPETSTPSSSETIFYQVPLIFVSFLLGIFSI